MAVFGDLPAESPVMEILADALATSPGEEEPVGEPFSQREREAASLGAMGAAQWTGRWRTRPHALLDVRGLASVEEWCQSLPRGARRTLAKALPEKQGFTVRSLPLLGGAPAPHSTLAHFRCVLAHEVRLLAAPRELEKAAGAAGEAARSGDDVVQAVAEACGRYMGTTRMAGEIREYRDAESGRVIAFAHEVEPSPPAAAASRRRRSLARSLARSIAFTP